jgi:hypothetical protein
LRFAANCQPPANCKLQTAQPALLARRAARHTIAVKCASCGSENPEGNAFCGSCGQKLIPAFEKVAVVGGEEGAYYCYRHKREPTLLSCGRCDRPVCTKCAIHGPAGIRCPDCARQHIAVRPMGVLNDFSRGFRGLFRGGGYSILIWFFVLSMVFGSVRGCMYMNQPVDGEPVEHSAPHDGEK